MDGLTLRLRDVSSGLDNNASSIDVDGRNVVVVDDDDVKRSLEKSYNKVQQIHLKRSSRE